MTLNPLPLFEPTNQSPPLGGRYKIISQLGAGAFGQTFLAQDLHLPEHPQCVVKQLKPQVSDPKSLQTARRLFDTEAKVLYQLGHHDQIPLLLAHFEDNQEFYLAQELIEGEPLTKKLVENQPWSQNQVVTLLQDILQVLTFVHQKQVIHRDIKPSNLICRHQDSRIVLIDFGAVKQVSTQIANRNRGKTDLTIGIGTKGYMPNEQLAGNPQFSSDVYAVGIIGIHALTGVKPTDLDIDFETSEINWRNHAGQVDPELASILERMVLYDFRARYLTAEAALKALQRLTNSAVETGPIKPAAENRAFGNWQSASQSTTIQEPINQVKHWSKAAVPKAEPTPPVAKSKEYLNKRYVSIGSPIFTALVSVIGTFVITYMFMPRVIYETVFVPKVIYKTLEKIKIVPRNFVSEESTTLNVVEQSQSSADSKEQQKTQSSRINLQSTPSEPEVLQLLSQADSLREAQKYQEAVEAYQQVVSRQADMAQAHWGHCYSLNKLGLFTEAITACQQGLQLQPNYPEALSSQGYALAQQLRHKEALKNFDQALNLNGNLAEAWSNRGVTLLSLDRPSEAVVAFKAATKIEPNYVEAWANLGVALWRIERFDEAISSIEQALEIQPDHSQSIALRRQAKVKLGL
ncbi:MAG: tetratricopeptide repeat protein [Symploca sp. SIO3C6]|uniref:non-specific serine/threonine protein kinase n=1 Tax=Symploca sp. SIO1C4 TaxID=2607765 RepID=A0A6B3NGM8_9CYAN|nr:tetratricopeptide repeat protein [Symploca sp. SIO3C6]NER30055.1 tetratricopeptide repeat protein [Symploca sp. SIO1C4]